MLATERIYGADFAGRYLPRSWCPHSMLNSFSHYPPSPVREESCEGGVCLEMRNARGNGLFSKETVVFSELRSCRSHDGPTIKSLHISEDRATSFSHVSLCRAARDRISSSVARKDARIKSYFLRV